MHTSYLILCTIGRSLIPSIVPNTHQLCVLYGFKLQASRAVFNQVRPGVIALTILHL